MALGKSKFSVCFVSFLETERACTVILHNLINRPFITRCFSIERCSVVNVFLFIKKGVLLGESDMKIFHCVSLTPLCQITRSGEFVLPLDSFHKKPYEVLILGRVQGSIKEAQRYARQWYKSLFEAAVCHYLCVTCS